jgi:hypothetical protein
MDKTKQNKSVKEEVLFSVKFDEETQTNLSEESTPQPLKRVSTQTFLTTKSAKLLPQHRIVQTNLFQSF